MRAIVALCMMPFVVLGALLAIPIMGITSGFVLMKGWMEVQGARLRKDKPNDNPS